MHKSYALLFATTLAACGGTTPQPTPSLPEGSLDAATAGAIPLELRDVVYARRPGVDTALTSLDVFRTGAPKAPSVLFVHGGGWRSGDKANLETSGAKDALLARGYAVISINIRLVQSPESPDATPAEQVEDVASATRWLVDNAARLDFDPAQIHLIGYSSGAHLVALTGTDARYLDAVGLAPDVFATISALDVSAYDVPRAIAEGCDLGYCDAAVNLPRIFGEDLEPQRRLSPITYARPDHALSPSFIVSAGYKDGQAQTLTLEQSRRFVDALGRAGGVAVHHHEPDLDHTDLMTALFAEGTSLAEALFGFLRAPTEPVPEPAPDACADVQADLRAAFDASTAGLVAPGGVVAAIRTKCGNFTFAAGSSGDAPLTADTPVRIGSESKTYTAALVLRAVERGTVSLEDPLARWLPRFPNAERITVAQLLNHTSGLADIIDERDFMSEVRADPERVWAPQEVLQVAVTMPAEFEPGADWSYSNTNYLVLGAIVADAFGQDLSALYPQQLFGPLGLDRTVFEARVIADPLARGYDARGQDVTFAIHPSVRGAAGAIAAPIAEVAAWGEALFAGDVLRADTLARMSQGVDTGTPGSTWGLGAQWLEHPTLGTLIGHTGSAPGFTSELRYAPALEATVAVTSTRDTSLPRQVRDALLGALAD